MCPSSFTLPGLSWVWAMRASFRPTLSDALTGTSGAIPSSLPRRDGSRHDAGGGVGRLPGGDPPAPARQEPSPADPLEPQVQALSGPVRRPRPLRAATVRFHPVGEEPQDLRALLQG